MPDAHVPPFSEYIPERDITVVTEVDAGMVVCQLFWGRISLAIALLPDSPHPLAVIRTPGTDAWVQHTRVVQAVRAGAYDDG